jgi:hypothetical protein
MNPAKRIVTHLPLLELWTERGPLEAVRERNLGRDDVKSLLQSGAVQFVVADVGKPLRWIPEIERLVFWKADARNHIVEEPENPVDIYAYPEGYAYVASEWVAAEPASPPIVVLERHH